MLDSGERIKNVTEKRVLATRHATILILLGQGYDEVCDDTNLP